MSEDPAAVTVLPAAGRPQEHRSVPLLSEPDLGHYPEFAAYLRAVFDLDRDPFGPAGLLNVDDRVYELVFLGRSATPFPAGVQINALVPALEPLDEHQADLDLWAVMGWLASGVGGDWNLEGLTTTGRLYHVPGA